MVESRVGLTATVDQDLQLTTENGTAPYTWSVVAGALPAGLDLSGTGRINGRAADVGTFPVTFEAVDAIGLPASGVVTFEVTPPTIALDRLASSFLLTGPLLDASEEAMLDRLGNRNDTYDLGDFRAWVLSNPGLPLSAFFEGTSRPRVIVVPMSSAPGGAR